jgi:hypothetical protein
VGPRVYPRSPYRADGTISTEGDERWTSPRAFANRVDTAPATPEAQAWAGWGTALKPAHEPIVVARKPLAGTVAGNVLAHGVGGLNIDGCRIGTQEALGRTNHVTSRFVDSANGSRDAHARTVTIDNSGGAGRWPANVCLSHTPDCRQVGTRRVRSNSPSVPQPRFDSEQPGNVSYGGGTGRNGAMSAGYADADGLETVAAWECSPECPVRMLDEQAGDLHGAGYAQPQGSRPEWAVAGEGLGWVGSGAGLRHGDTGGPSRFFYTAKASTSERDGATHPTVKPLDLMRWLVRLVTPPGGTVLDPFAGSGTTLIACRAEGFACVGIERDPEYVAMALERIRRRYDPAAAAWAGEADDGQLSLLGGG